MNTTQQQQLTDDSIKYSTLSEVAFQEQRLRNLRQTYGMTDDYSWRGQSRAWERRLATARSRVELGKLSTERLASYLWEAAVPWIDALELKLTTDGYRYN